MKILCFGDSLTWGYTPYGGRYPQPWPEVLQQYRKQDVIINAGQPGRTAYGSCRVLSTMLLNHHPDVTCIMLGSNDLSLDCGRDIGSVIQDLMIMGKEVLRHGKVILMAPPVINEEVDPGWNYASGISSVMTELADQISVLCKKQNWYFFNTQEFVKPVVPDGLHIDQNSHLILGKTMNDFLNQVI